MDVFIAKRTQQVRLRGNTRRSLPDYIFRGPLRDQYFVVECKGTQSRRPAAINQLQRGTEQVVTVDIDPPAAITRLVIGSWLNPTISLLLVDPDERPEVRNLSRWSVQELRSFAEAKRLTYIGDYGGAVRALHDFVETIPLIEYEPRELALRKTGHGTFEGSEETRRTPDGRELRMFRGIRPQLPPEPVLQSESQSGDERESPFILETDSEPDHAMVRSISPDGSVFEVDIR